MRVVPADHYDRASSLESRSKDRTVRATREDILFLRAGLLQHFSFVPPETPEQKMAGRECGRPKEGQNLQRGTPFSGMGGNRRTILPV
jgi:hypothetical protein